MQDSLQALIPNCLMAQQHGLRMELARLAKLPQPSEKRAQAYATLEKKIAASTEQVAARRASIPLIEYPEALPVSAMREEIKTALLDSQVLVLAGDTGSGKTTQLPKMCLELGFGARGLIGHTQPRRIAARAVAARIAEEINTPLGKSIGYQVRFTDNTEASTLVKLMTDGILLAEIQQDRFLNKYEVLIIDEAHERSLNIDFLLGYLQQLLRKRKDLKLIITSATIDVEKFSQYFAGAPVVSVAGRTFPVDILYRPLEREEDDSTESNKPQGDPLSNAIITALHEIEALERKQKQAPGDVLIFLSGERDIRDLALELRKQPMRNTEVLPLYARLTPAEQNKIFATHTGRRIVLSTNVAETSLTVPGIVYVIDTGYARISRYSIQSKVQRLPIERISQASANQRSGRCGRVSHGTCIRLYGEDDFLSRAEFTDPEIQRTNLSAVILQMLMLRLGDIESFPFLDKPEQKAINDGYKLLLELGAIDKARQISPIGRKMAAIPADPRLGRMLIDAAARACLQELLIIVSALSVQDPRESPPEKRQAAREQHQHFAHPESDFLSWVLLWEEYEAQRQALNQNGLRQFCKKHFLSFMRMREWRETHRQLHLTCQQLGFKENRRADARAAEDEINYEAVHRAILSGSLNQLGMKGDDGQYNGSRGRRFAIFPSSVLARKGPKWVVTGELIETSRLYATMLGRIEPKWAVEAAGELVKRDYAEAHWEKSRGQVVAFEKISLFGLVLIEKQRVDFSRIDPKLSREIFIREALVGLSLKTRADFYAHNLQMLEALRKEEEKLRRPDIIVGEDQLFDFYNGKIPVAICDSRSLEHWLKKESQQGRKNILHMTKEDLLHRDVDVDLAHYFPDTTIIQNNPVAIAYAFKPGSNDDGTFIDLPVGILAQMRLQDLDWMIPGTIKERCVLTLKGLPKMLRKQFIPVPDFVDEFVETLSLSPNSALPEASLLTLLKDFARRKKNIQLDLAELESVELPPHLRPWIRVLDEDGKTLAKGQSLQALQDKYCKGAITAVAQGTTHPIERAELRDWDFGSLPKEVLIDAKISVIRYPALVDHGDSVAIVLQETPQLADSLSRKGLITLLIARSAQQKRAILDMLKKLHKTLTLKIASVPSDFENEGLRAIYQLAFDIAQASIPENLDGFERLLNSGKSELIPTAERFTRLLRNIVDEAFALRRQLAAVQAPEFSQAKRDITAQLEALFVPSYLSSTPADYLLEYPRYLKAITMRLEKLPGQVQKDAEYTININKLQDVIRKEIEASRVPNEALVNLRWSIEELRVSIFAQTLGTRFPISEKRITKRLDELRRLGRL